MMVTDATSAYSIFDTCRLNYVELWAVAENTVRDVSISLEFPGGVIFPGTRSVRHSDTMLGSGARPLHIKASPPKNSFQSFWGCHSTKTAFVLTLSQEAYVVVDVNISYVLNETGTAQTAFTVAGATEGVVVYGSLDTGNVLGPTNMPRALP